MATDFLLLQRFPEPADARFRHYGWRKPAWTFGYSQKISWVRGQIPAEPGDELCRRPTGGGIVDHREDWTYALVIPRGHSLEEQRAAESYRIIHETLAAALRAQGIDAQTKPCEPAAPASEASEALPAGVCFTRAEVFDVIHAETGVKIAGAAQKRTKHGLLFQGSIWQPAVSGIALNWAAFRGRLCRKARRRSADTSDLGGMAGLQRRRSERTRGSVCFHGMAGITLTSAGNLVPLPGRKNSLSFPESGQRSLRSARRVVVCSALQPSVP